jgi:L-2-hydroxyglutarate oxidase LhgO
VDSGIVPPASQQTAQSTVAASLRRHRAESTIAACAASSPQAKAIWEIAPEVHRQFVTTRVQQRKATPDCQERTCQ